MLVMLYTMLLSCVGLNKCSQSAVGLMAINKGLTYLCLRPFFLSLPAIV